MAAWQPPRAPHVPIWRYRIEISHYVHNNNKCIQVALWQGRSMYPTKCARTPQPGHRLPTCYTGVLPACSGPLAGLAPGAYKARFPPFLLVLCAWLRRAVTTPAATGCCRWFALLPQVCSFFCWRFFKLHRVAHTWNEGWFRVCRVQYKVVYFFYLSKW